MAQIPQPRCRQSGASRPSQEARSSTAIIPSRSLWVSSAAPSCLYSRGGPRLRHVLRVGHEGSGGQGIGSLLRGGGARGGVSGVGGAPDNGGQAGRYAARDLRPSCRRWWTLTKTSVGGDARRPSSPAAYWRSSLRPGRAYGLREPPRVLDHLATVASSER